MTQMAVRTMGVIGSIGMVPVADDAGSKNQQRHQRQQNREYANRLPHDCRLALRLHLQHVSRLGHHFVKHWIDEDSQQKP